MLEIQIQKASESGSHTISISIEEENKSREVVVGESGVRGQFPGGNGLQCSCYREGKADEEGERGAGFDDIKEKAVFGSDEGNEWVVRVKPRVPRTFLGEVWH